MKKSLLASLLLVSLGACGDTTLPAVSGDEGALRFDYAGAQSGSFLAHGDGAALVDGFAVGLRSGGWISLDAARVAGDGTQTEIRISFPEKAAPYTVSVDWSQCPADGACPGGLAFISFPAGDPNRASVFAFSGGEIHVTSISGGRIRGTFSGSGGALSNATGTLRYQDGSFDVPLSTPQT